MSSRWNRRRCATVKKIFRNWRHFFCNRSAERCKRQVQGLSRDAQEMMMHTLGPAMCGNWKTPWSGPWCWVFPNGCCLKIYRRRLLEAAPRDAGTKYHRSVGQAKREAIVDAYVQGKGDYKLAAARAGTAS